MKFMFFKDIGKAIDWHTYNPKLSAVVTTWKVSKCGIFSGPNFSVFGLNTGKYGPEKTPCLETFQAMHITDASNY